MKTLWVVGAGAEAIPGILTAKAMGLFVVAADGNRHAPGFAYADAPCFCDTYDAQEMALLAKVFDDHRRIDGVIAMCSDVPFTVATVQNRLGLRGLPLGVAALGQNKLAMKHTLESYGIPTAEGWEVRSGKEIRQLIDFLGTGVVVKPLDSRGARGVTICNNRDAADTAYSVAVAHSPSRKVLAEEWLPGPQLSTEGAMLPDGKFVTVAILDRNYSRLQEFAPYIIEDGADGPTRLSLSEQMEVDKVFEAAARAVVGDTPCTVKGDMVLTPEGPFVIELALRLSGGYMSTKLIPMMTGVDFVAAAIKLALGERVTADDLMPRAKHGWGVAIRFTIPVGCTSHPERLGYAIGTAATRDAAIAEALKSLPCQ